VPRLSDTQRQVLGQWWTLAMSGAYGGFLTTDVIAAAADLARQAGGSLSFTDAGALSTLYGYARRMSNASDALANAAGTDVIDPSVIGVPPWAREQQAMNTTPIWHVSYDFTSVGADGSMTTDVRTSVFDMALPQTIGALQAAIESDAESLANKYNVSLVQASLKEILAV
jgi:hypothetical protein